jgi:trans-AT polyketide synthase/acyltransferase/oxidoreductase domain-containing protein
MTMPIVNKAAIQEQVERWNEHHPVGTAVSVRGRTEPKVTRTPAMMLFEQKAVIYLAGHNGYFDLDDVAAATVKVIPPAAAPIPAAPPPVSGWAAMFPGQGSQKAGMGAGLFEAFPDLIRAADEVLGYSIRELCLVDPEGALDQTKFTQPALYTVNALAYLRATAESGSKPGCVLGHSLGEYNALFAAGVFDFITGLRLVQKRGALMAEAQGGGMAAVIGLSAERVREILAEGGEEGIDLANLNSPTQVVISGRQEEILRVQERFEKAGARLYLPLKVSGAFHSRYMKEAQGEFRLFLDTFAFNSPAIAVISNVSGKPYEPGRIVASLAEQLTSPVRWTDSIRYLRAQGVEIFRELGPGTVLAGLLKKIPIE